MATSPEVRLPPEPVCCAEALVARASKPVPMVTAPAAANPVFRKLRRFGELLITLPSFVIFVPPSQRFVGVACADSVILVGLSSHTMRLIPISDKPRSRVRFH